MLFEFDHIVPLRDQASVCAFCTTPLEAWSDRHPLKSDQRGTVDALSLTVMQCPTCGWWTASRSWTRNWHIPNSGRSLHDIQEWRACGVLKQLDLRSLDTPLQEVRDYLSARYSERGNVHHRMMEMVVESILKNFGFRTLLTPQSGDDGIDVLLYGPDDTTVGVQVKRYKNAITAEQIRAFTGALMLGDHVGGLYVTTEGYEPGARRTADRAWAKGTPIHLVDAESLLAVLRVAQRTVPRNTEELRKLAGRLNGQDLLAHEFFS